MSEERMVQCNGLKYCNRPGCGQLKPHKLNKRTCSGYEICWHAGRHMWLVRCVDVKV